jgi:hypothetical protein
MAIAGISYLIYRPTFRFHSEQCSGKSRKLCSRNITAPPAPAH